MLHLVLLIFIIFITTTNNTAHQWWNNNVPELTDININHKVGKGKLVIIDFFTPWCHYCQKIAPEYLKLYEHFKNSENVLITKVNCEDKKP